MSLAAAWSSTLRVELGGCCILDGSAWREGPHGREIVITKSCCVTRPARCNEICSACWRRYCESAVHPLLAWHRDLAAHLRMLEASARCIGGILALWIMRLKCFCIVSCRQRARIELAGRDETGKQPAAAVTSLLLYQHSGRREPNPPVPQHPDEHAGQIPRLDLSSDTDRRCLFKPPALHATPPRDLSSPRRPSRTPPARLLDHAGPKDIPAPAPARAHHEAPAGEMAGRRRAGHRGHQGRVLGA